MLLASIACCGWHVVICVQLYISDSYLCPLPTAPVHAFVLPPASARLPWSCCVLSVSEDGSLALLCLASRRVMRTFRGPLAGPPLQLAWSTAR